MVLLVRGKSDLEIGRVGLQEQETFVSRLKKSSVSS